MSVLGLDLGSREAKLVVVQGGHVIWKQRMATMRFYRDCCTHGETRALRFDVLGMEPPDRVVVTGYGRNHLQFEGVKVINEIRAHASGAMRITGKRDFILLDMGGQDVKVMRVENGLVTDLALNDKCAASCGRFLENMASVLEVSMETLCMYHENPVRLSATCAVFSESELIGRIAEGVPVSRLCAGVNEAVFQRVRGLLTAFHGPELLLSGGVAQNRAMQNLLKQDFGQVTPIPDAVFCGALGCCQSVIPPKD